MTSFHSVIYLLVRHRKQSKAVFDVAIRKSSPELVQALAETSWKRGGMSRSK